MADNKDRFEITELFMTQSSKDRRFYSTIQRGSDSDGHPVVFGKIKVLNGFVCAIASNQDVLGSWLDELVLMSLEYGLHEDRGVTSTVGDQMCFLN